MSIKTWKEEFYSVDARLVLTKRGAILHSIRKWKGLSPENLERHEITKDWSLLSDADEDWFSVDVDSCALCTRYFVRDGLPCLECPLYKLLGARCDYGTSSPYSIFLNSGNPEPMIMALEKVLLNTMRMEDR